MKLKSTLPIALFTGILIAGAAESCSLAPSGCTAAPKNCSLTVTSETKQFAKRPLFLTAKGTETIHIDTDNPRQTMEGFGGSFNEQGWEALMSLSAADRENVLREIFDPAIGLRFNICRTPIGSSDYALSRYTLAEKTNDYKLESFSIARDKQYLIPYIQAAMRFNPSLKVWASAWSPPIWMKDNNQYEGGKFRDEPVVYASYAEYLKRFVESYRALGIDLYMVVPQNEPGQLTGYPSCDWAPEQYRIFIRDYLGPLFAKEKNPAQIWLGTINKNEFDAHIKTTLSDPKASAFITGVGLQWDGLGAIGKVKSEYPDKKIMQTETDCGNWTWKPGFNKDKAANDFEYGAYTWKKFRSFITGGAQSYMLWNIVLNENGKNIDNKLPWPQNSAIVVDRNAKTVTYTPMFWATKHFSHFVLPGARFLESSGTDAAKSVAFMNPDGTVVVELLNESFKELPFTVQIGKLKYVANVPARSFATLIAGN